TPVLAFSDAEGGGRYSEGARGSSAPEVYHVTNLNDSGEGSLRDALSKSGRYVVFDVDGTIELQSTLKIPSNTTIWGQTAPGEGITVTGYDVQTENGAHDIIVRYFKVRPTDGNGSEPDGLGGRYNTNVIFDHCSVSWSVDELITLYAGSWESVSDTAPHGSNLTVQNTLASESLRMSSHFKGAHGYGGFMGGDIATYHHNLLAHHDSRSPRLDREMDGTEVVNNVIYDWGQTNSAYGGEPGSMHYTSFNPTRVNYTDNYYQYGPSTRSSLRYRIFQVTNDTSKSDGHLSDFYFNGNYVAGSTSVTNDNSQGVDNSANANLLSEPVTMVDSDDNIDYALTPDTASEAYSVVLENVGATIPKRDAIDARIVDDVKHLTGRVINNATEVGGLIDFTYTPTETRTFTIDSDWVTEKGLSAYGETDVITEGDYAGYSLIEAYVNEWTDAQSAPTNPSITVTSPTVASNGNSSNLWTVGTVDSPITYTAAATAVGGVSVTKMELYDGNDLIKTYEGASSINDSISLSEGTHYLTCRAYNANGEKTQSTEAIVYIKGTEPTEEQANGFTFKEIGTSGKYTGQGGIAANDDGSFTLYGSGTSGYAGSSSVGTAASSDNCSYYYTAVDGNFDIVINVGAIEKFENQATNGLMMRETLDAKSRMVMISDSMLKYGENDRLIYRTTAGSSSTVEYFKSADNVTVENSSSGDNYDVAPYMRIVRYGDDVYTYLSQTGEDWTDDVRQSSKITLDGLADTVYIGYAADSADTVSVIPYFACSDFTIVSLATGDDVEDPGESDQYYTPTYVDHTTSNGFSYSESFLMDDNVGGNWIVSSDGTLDTTATEVKSAVEGNDTPKLSLNDKAVQIEVPEEYQTGDYTIDYDFLTTNTADAGRSFRFYLDNTVHAYNASTGQATEMGTDGAFLHIMDVGSTAYATKTVADIAAKSVSSDMDSLWNVEANKWYHITLEGTNGGSDLTLTVSLHGTDGQYAPDNLSEAVFSGKVSITADRETTLKQIKFMRTAAGTLYFDNIVFAGGSAEESTEATTEDSSEATTEAGTPSGDVDGNGYLTANDAAVALYYVLNNEAELNPSWDVSLGTADMDGSGVIEANDAAIILRKVIDSAYNYTAE
ncbi:MAG: hypothetical protein LIO44_04545, partial [Eubacterium sp.]|nr:hypothetical protein [Eubacterium sp.]